MTGVQTCALPIYSGTLIYLWGINAWLPTYLQAQHFDLKMVGFYSALPFALMIPGQLFFAWLGDRTGKRAAVCCGTQIMTGVFMYLATRAGGADLAAWLIAISAFFWGGITPPLFAISAEIMPRRVTAAGFGLSLILNCDLAIAADDSYFTLAYRHIGLSADGGATYFLPRVVGERKALEIALLGERFTAQEAKEQNILNWVVPKAQLAAETEKLARKLADGPTFALGVAKRLIRTS